MKEYFVQLCFLMKFYFSKKLLCFVFVSKNVEHTSCNNGCLLLGNMLRMLMSK